MKNSPIVLGKNAIRMAPPEKVDFFIVGAPKSGTTALARYLSEHPLIYMSDPKEPQYFTFDFPGHRGVADWTEYLGLFSAERTAGRRVSGEASVWYLYSKAAIPAIRKAFPSAKLIVILRRPDEMLPSLYAQQRRMGIETAKSFCEAWEMESMRRAGRRIPIACRTPEFLYYQTVANYGEQLERLYKQFPAEQVRVFLYEDLRQSPRRVYTDVLRFLGIESDNRMNFPIINAYADVRFPIVQSILVWLRQMARAFQRRVVKPSGTLHASFGGVTAFMDRWNRRAGRKPTLRRDTRNRINACYQHDIARLERLIGRDLRAWTETD